MINTTQSTVTSQSRLLELYRDVGVERSLPFAPGNRHAGNFERNRSNGELSSTQTDQSQTIQALIESFTSMVRELMDRVIDSLAPTPGSEISSAPTTNTDTDTATLPGDAPSSSEIKADAPSSSSSAVQQRSADTSLQKVTEQLIQITERFTRLEKSVLKLEKSVKKLISNAKHLFSPALRKGIKLLSSGSVLKKMSKLL